MRGQTANLALLVLISALNGSGQILMRWGGVRSVQEGRSAASVGGWCWTSRWWLLGIAAGWVAGLGWAWCLRRLPLGIAIPLYAGLAYLLSVLGAAFLLRERMTAPQIAGAGIILAGILLVTLSSAPHPAVHSGP